MIVVSFTVGIYRQKSSLKAGAGYGAICAASILSALSSIRLHLSALKLALERPALRLPTAASHRVFWPAAQARLGWHRRHAVRSFVAIPLAFRQWPLVYEQEATPSSGRVGRSAPTGSAAAPCAQPAASIPVGSAVPEEAMSMTWQIPEEIAGAGARAQSPNTFRQRCATMSQPSRHTTRWCLARQAASNRRVARLFATKKVEDQSCM